MVWWQAALWAVAGGFVVEGLEFSALRRLHRRWPWQIDADATGAEEGTAAGPLGYAVGELLRLAAGGVLGAALAGQVTGPLPALAIGAAAPVIAGHLVAYVPLPPPQVGTSAPSLATNGTFSSAAAALDPVDRAAEVGPVPEREGTP